MSRTAVGEKQRSDANRKHHNVYVIRLDEAVLKDRKFAAENPQRDPAKPCVYVGMTGHTPEERFKQHKAGIKSCRLVEKYGTRLMRGLYENFNPMTYEEAARMEPELAQRLRANGFAVWQR
jgi:hypothetical protein